MAYTPLGLKDGEKVYASHVTHVEDGIADCESQITEVKDSLSELETNGLFGNGIALTAGIDLNDITDYGHYNSASSTISAGITNAPLTGAGFALFVIRSGSSVVQIAINGGSSATVSTLAYLFFRTKATSGDWRNWFEVTATVQS